MGFFGRFWARIRGFFLRTGDDFVSSSPEDIRSTYASAIDDAKKRYKEMQEAVALLAREREKTSMALKKLMTEEAELQKKLNGALAMAESEPENSAHREAGTRYLARMKEIEARQQTFNGDLDVQTQKVEEYKSKLREFTSEIEKLKREQGEMVAEFVSHKQVIQLEDRLKGIGDTAVDESIVAIREKIASMRSEARIASEMRTTSTAGLDEQYERLGAEKEASNRFDELLKARAASKTAVPEKDRDLG